MGPTDLVGNPFAVMGFLFRRLAEILTLGQADPYDIHITWHAPSTLVLDENGNVISSSGYPHN